MTAGERSNVGAAFLLALGLHLGVVAAIAFWPADPAVKPPGEQEITIDLAPAMEAAQPVDAVEAVAPTPNLPVEETISADETTDVQPEEIEEVPASQEIVEAAPADEAVPIDDAEAVETISPPKDAVVAKAVEDKPAKPGRKPPPRREERKPAPRREVAASQPAPSRIQAGQASSSRDNMGGLGASADPNVLNRYAAQLTAALRRRLRYPDVARGEGISGVATIRFTLERSGRIVSASLVRSTGSAVLDQAALVAAKPGSNLPAAPEAVPQQLLTFAVPLRFDLR